MSNEAVVAIISGGFLIVNTVIAVIMKIISKRQENLHVMINSRMTQLLETTEKLARLVGMREGIAEQKQEAKDDKAQTRLENKEDNDSKK